MSLHLRRHHSIHSRLLHFTIATTTTTITVDFISLHYFLNNSHYYCTLLSWIYFSPSLFLLKQQVLFLLSFFRVLCLFLSDSAQYNIVFSFLLCSNKYIYFPYPPTTPKSNLILGLLLHRLISKLLHVSTILRDCQRNWRNSFEFYLIRIISERETKK